MSGKRKDGGDGPRVISIGVRPAPKAESLVDALATPEDLACHAEALAACEAEGVTAPVRVASLAAMASGPKARPALSVKREEGAPAAPVERLKPRQT